MIHQGIYIITNKTNGRQYVGQSVSIERRWAAHLKNYLDSSKYGGARLLYEAMHKYGKENFDWEILELVQNSEDLDQREQYWILNKNTLAPNGYNLKLDIRNIRGENNPHSKLSKEEVIEIQDLLKNTKLSFYEIADRYKLHYSNIYRINRGESWPDPKIIYPIRSWNAEARPGEKSGRAKITNQQVYDLRKLYVNHSIQELYAINNYGYSMSGFKKIVQGTTFKCVPVYKKSEKRWIYPDE